MAKNESCNGGYTLRLGYKDLIEDVNREDEAQWWKLLWKTKAPLKPKIYVICAL